MAEALGKRAYVVAADVLPEDVGQETLRLLSAAGGKGELKRLDVTNGEQVDEAFKELHKRLGRLDIVVNNAGIARDNLLLRVSDEDIQKTFAVNVTGLSTVRPGGLMMRAQTGRIINLASVAAEPATRVKRFSSASKAALIGLTKTLAGSTPARHHGQCRGARFHRHRHDQESAGGCEEVHDRANPAGAHVSRRRSSGAIPVHRRSVVHHRPCCA
jgi:3-oxoacyl-[acyl-carrier protein] reductase